MIRGAALLAVISAALCACSPVAPGPSPIPSLQPVALHGEAVGLRRALVNVSIVPRLGDSPDGPQLLSEPDGLPQPLDAGRSVVILSEPRAGPGGPWVRVWVQTSTEAWPSDFYAWLPTTERGRETLRAIEPIRCPTEATIQTLAPLVQQDRLRCAGATTVTIDARSGQLGMVPLYDVDPAWYGINAGPPTTALFDPGPARFGPDATTSPQANRGWIEPRVPPDVPPLPLGLYLRVTGQFDDPSAAGCRRAVANAIPGQGPPVEAVADSVAWCREQFVVHSWQALLGPEGRPIDPADPQLHRREFRVPLGALLACGGVGMPPLTIRIDPTQVDPVWIALPGGGRSVAQFGPEFRLLLDPPRVQATTGVTLVDGEVVDPDHGKPGLSVCPGGEVVTFDVLAR